MNTLKKNINFNDYSSLLFSEFSQIAKKINNSHLRETLFDNDDLLRFINKLQLLYNEVVLNDKDLNLIMSSAIDSKGETKFKLLLNEFESLNKNPDSDYLELPLNFDSKFMAKEANRIIKNKRIWCVNYTSTFCGVNLNIRFNSNKKWFDKKNKDILQAQKVARILRRIIFIIKLFSKHTCHKGETLMFDLFLIDTPKLLPNRRLDKLDQDSINSGYTTFFNDGENTKTIIIYRAEEMEKLVIHELIHFFYLDFKILNIDMSQVLNVSPNIEFIPNEAFTEFLTILIQSSIIPLENEFKKAYIKKPNRGFILNTNSFYKNEIDFKKMLHFSLEILYIEILFGYFQCAKILFQYNISKVSDFFKKYDKKTNIFFYQKSCIISYFFIKVALLTNIDQSFAFFLLNQDGLKINISIETRQKYQTLVFASLANTEYQISIQKSLNLINKIVFNKQVKKKINKSCKSKKKCINKKMRYFNLKQSFKKGTKTYKNLILNTRMSLIEL